MGNIRRFVGIDISKDTFDTCILTEDGEIATKHHKYNDAGMQSFGGKISDYDVCVMEATGTYHIRLAMNLLQAGKKVYVANPLCVSHFSRMRMNRAKTDSKDAETIAEYARMNERDLRKFIADDPEYVEVKQLLALLDLLQKQMTQLKNQEEAINHAYVQSGAVKSSIKKQKASLEKEIAKIEKTIEDIVDKHNHDDFERLQSIPGIGKKTAAVILATTSDMRRFDSYKQVCSYFGFCPRIYDSGTSVHGKARICKMGMSRIRRLLYVCSWSAITYNEACRNLYERLVAAGKPKMKALIAVAHKLIKIAFALIKNKTMYEHNFLQKRACILT